MLALCQYAKTKHMYQYGNLYCLIRRFVCMSVNSSLMRGTNRSFFLNCLQSKNKKGKKCISYRFHILEFPFQKETLKF